MTDSTRAKLEHWIEALDECLELDSILGEGRILGLSNDLTSILAQLEELERDHEAMNEMRSRKMDGYLWRRVHGDLMQLSDSDTRRSDHRYDDPADAILD